jgi:hypothetical protein
LSELSEFDGAADAELGTSGDARKEAEHRNCSERGTDADDHILEAGDCEPTSTDVRGLSVDSAPRTDSAGGLDLPNESLSSKGFDGPVNDVLSRMTLP